MFFKLPFECSQRAVSVFEVFCQPCDCRGQYIHLSWFHASSFPFLPKKMCLNHSSLEVTSHRRHWPQCVMSSLSQFHNFSTYLLTSCVFHSISTYFTEKKVRAIASQAEKLAFDFSSLEPACSESSKFIPRTALWHGIWFPCSYGRSFTGK